MGDSWQSAQGTGQAGLLDEGRAADLAEIYGALADPTRLKLIAALAESELCVGDLAALLGMSISAISHQLHLLRRMRIVRRRREGRHIYYALDDEHVLALFRAGLSHIEHT